MNFLKKNTVMFLTVLSVGYLSDASASVAIPGEGAKAIGMGSVAVALPQDSFAMITNPATTAFMDNRVDLNVSYLKSNDDVKILNNALIPHKDYNSSADFIIPSAGIKKDYGCLDLGLCAYGRGSGTNYGRHIPITGTSKLRLNFKHFIAKPCLAWKFAKNQSIGIGVNLVLAIFEQYGVQNYRALSASPNHVTNHHYDYKPGIGVSVGWMGRYFNKLNLGIAYDTEIFTQKFNKYKGLLAQKGKANGPSIFTVGLSYDVTCKLLVAFDFQRYFWEYMKAYSNDLSFVHPLGSSKGSGFGWKNEDRYKVGAAYRICDSLTVRGGYIYKKPNFAKSQIYNNLSGAITFPSQYITGGCTWHWGCHEINAAYLQSLKRSLNGDLPVLVGGGKIRTKSMTQLVSLSYGYLF